LNDWKKSYLLGTLAFASLNYRNLPKIITREIHSNNFFTRENWCTSDNAYSAKTC